MNATPAALRSQRFRQAREADWRRLETLLAKAEKGRAARLSDEDILAIPVLYRATLSALSVARETSLDRDMIDYLETLSARAYFFVYGSRETLAGRVRTFFRHDWPRAVSGLWRETLVAAGLMALGVLAAAAMVHHDPDWFHALAPAELAQGRGPAASTEALRETLSGVEDADGLTVFSTSLFTHNAQVALLAFALGFALCLPTGLLMIYNGAILGAFAALFVSRGLGLELGGWLLIHGVTELFAIVLAGAAGLRIGWSVTFPGQRSRLDAAAEAGREAALVMAGVVVMLFFAGLLEGFGRQLIAGTGWRYAVAAATALIWGVYFYASRPNAAWAETRHGR